MNKTATKPEVSGDTRFDTKPAAIEAWISALPVANLGETSRRLYTALVDLNEQDLDSRTRVSVLDRLSEYVSYATDAMKKHFVGKRFPLETRDYQVARLAQALSIQFALGYQIAALQQLEQSGGRKGRSVIQTALYRAMEGYETTLLRTYQIYASYPRGLWKRIHRLYAVAEAHDFQSYRPETEENPAYSIADVYKRLLLLALAGPYRLRQTETESVEKFIRELAAKCTLSGIDDNADAGGMFVVDLDGDNPPTYFLAQEEYNHDSCRLFNTTPLAQTVHDYLENAPATDDADHGVVAIVSQPVLRRLMLGWGVLPKRRYSRKRNHAAVFVANGLSAAHYFISGEVAFAESPAAIENADSSGQNTLFEARSHFESKPLQSQQKAHARDVWEIGGERPAETDHDHLGTIDFETPGTPGVETRFARYQTEEWKMVDDSAGGYRLLWDSADASDAQVGELVGIRESDDPDTFHLSIGIVRWLKCTPKHGMELGVEMISPGAVAVAIRLLRPDGSCSQHTRALLLPAVESIGQPATLLTPTLPYCSGDRIIVNIHGKETQAELGKLIENTGCIAQFQFTSADVGSGTLKDADPSQAEPEDFDTLWGAI